MLSTKRLLSPSSFFKEKGFFGDKMIAAELLSLCADLLYYPAEDIKLRLKKVLDLSDSTKKVEDVLENKSFDDIQSHYIGLFDSNIGGVECVPYESWWTKKRLMGKEAVEVLEFYKKCGFEFNDDEFKIPPDHIAVEIAFLSRLLEENRIREMCEFMDEHLLWVGRLRDCAEKNSIIYGTILSIVEDNINLIKEEGLCLKEF